MNKKKLREQKRRAMDQEIYRSLETKEERSEHIATRKAASRKKQQDRKELELLKKEQKKAGLQFVKNDLARKSQDLVFFEGNIAQASVTAVAMLVTLPDGIGYKVAYSLCSRRDTPDFETGISHVGWRIKGDEKHPFTFIIRLSKKGALKPQNLQMHIRLHIEMDIATGRVQVPRPLLRNLKRGTSGSTLFYIEDFGLRLQQEVLLKRPHPYLYQCSGHGFPWQGVHR